MKNKVTSKVLDIIDSRWFFRFVIIFFVFEAAWIALTAIYPQAFDEQYHFGLIQLYSHHLSPFLSKQPPGANQFGAVARDPSYLYHYLMSFPYRLIEIITKNQTYQVIALRFINIALFTWGLVLFRKLLVKSQVSRGLANITILIFALIPIAPQLAGQINYDNLMFPLVAITLLISFKLIDEIKKLKPKFITLAALLIIATFTSIVKFAYLPIYLAIVLFFAYYLIRYYRKQITEIWQNFYTDFKRHSLVINSVLISLFILAVGMFIQRDGVNLIKYHSIDPNCSNVLSVNSCKPYSAWYADYRRHEAVIKGKIEPSRNVIVYSGEWLYWMWYRLFFAINGPASKYTSYPPLPLPSAVAIIIGAIGLFAVIKYRKKLFSQNAYSTLLLMAVLIYAVALFTQGYSTYRYTAVLENMNGRYLIPILLLAGALLAKAFSIALKKKSMHIKVAIAGVAVLLFLQGGGVLTYISRSDDSWYFQNSKAIKVNRVAKKIANKIVVRGNKSYDTSVWFFN